ncbi:MAG: helix-turn-helix domain-containing protein [Anaerococcus vaginalis]|uniref:LexA family protein n=1 Tax=Anaerococcus vaginalis TaxID=33037 RepID=UPI001D872F33|nr:XRE family transcriptional regulator [Anaerococcus vaginalis]MBS4889395.1 helix-turn-helix domain-containing protein [Anaerococcus vaginalis]
MIGKQLKSLRKDNGYTQSDLAKKLHLTPKAISFYENNQREPDIDTLNKIADIFNVSIDYLNGRKSLDLKKGEDYATINVYGSIPAGIPIEAIEDISDTEDISFKDFDKNKTYIGLKVEGDSMYPKYLDGDTIILELTPDCESGTDAAVYVNGYEATLKTVIKNDNGTITLKPINTSYSPKTYGKDDEPIKILGIVKEIRRKI